MDDKKLEIHGENVPEKVKTEHKKVNTLVRLIGEVDRPFLMLVFALVCLGSIMVFSASYAFAQTRFNDSYFFARKQLGWIGLGFLTLGLCAKFLRPIMVKNFVWIGYGVSILLNIAVIFIGDEVKGATRQITFLGINFQPSELLKFFTIIVCAKYISEHTSKMSSFKYGILPFALLAIPSTVLCILQKHLSATIIILLLIYFMMLLGGSHLGWVGTIGAVGAFGAVFVATNISLISNLSIFKNQLSHVLLRLLVWENPFAYMKYPPTDPGWQPSQSIYAISSGGFWGVGLGNSIEKHGYLPEPQNDYIFSILCEEMGFAGAIVVIALFAALIIRGFQIAKRCTDKFSSLVVMGLVSKLGLQVILNIAVVTNVIPSTGISLPFFSYGGTALLILLAEMGLILSISRYSFAEN
ncbi:MAG: putative peptidoglycan glycosyltransferase FtsW [Clostridia bacterium]